MPFTNPIANRLKYRFSFISFYCFAHLVASDVPFDRLRELELLMAELALVTELALSAELALAAELALMAELAEATFAPN